MFIRLWSEIEKTKEIEENSTIASLSASSFMLVWALVTPAVPAQAALNSITVKAYFYVNCLKAIKKREKKMSIVSSYMGRNHC